MAETLVYSMLVYAKYPWGLVNYGDYRFSRSGDSPETSGSKNKQEEKKKAKKQKEGHLSTSTALAGRP